MSIQDELEEKNRRYRIEVIKFLEKIWNIKSNSLPEGMPQKMVLYKGRIKTLLDILLEEEIKQKDKEDINNDEKKEEKEKEETDDVNYDFDDGDNIIDIDADYEKI